jgi:hypothetical protein
MELSLGGCSPYTSTDKTRINIHKRNNTKTQYKQYKTQHIQEHILPKHPHNCKTNTHYKTHTYTHPHTTKPVQTTTVQDSHQTK